MRSEAESLQPSSGEGLRSPFRRLALFGTLLLPLFFLGIGCGDRGGKPVTERESRLVLIGVDGGSWNLLDPMIAAGELPHLAALLARGASAELVSVEPTNSPTVWTSIATGRSPEVHGVTFFNADRRSLRATTLWERFAAAGLRVGLYEYLVTWPPRELPGGFMLPGWLRRDDSQMPPDLEARLGQPPYVYSMEGVDGPDAIVANVEGEIAHKAATWNRLVESFDLDAGAVVFYSVDAVCHRFWHAASPEDFDPPVTAAEARFQPVIENTLRGIDQAIGEIVDALTPQDHVVIVSDHGFGPRQRGLRRQWAIKAKALLARLGVDADSAGVTDLINWESLVLRLGPGPERGREEILRRIEEGLSNLRTEGGEALLEVQAIHLAKPDPEEEISRWMGKVIKSAGPAHGLIFARLNRLAFDPLWPDGEVELAGERFSLGEIAAPHDFSGNHRLKGIFLAAGGGIRHRPERGELSVLDLAPLLSYLANQPIPDDLEGHLDRDLITPSYLRSHHPRQIKASEVPTLDPIEGAEGESATSAEEESELNKKLRALGYI